MKLFWSEHRKDPQWTESLYHEAMETSDMLVLEVNSSFHHTEVRLQVVFDFYLQLIHHFWFSSRENFHMSFSIKINLTLSVILVHSISAFI